MGTVHRPATPGQVTLGHAAEAHLATLGRREQANTLRAYSRDTAPQLQGVRSRRRSLT
jgi:hypothetical protein